MSRYKSSGVDIDTKMSTIKNNKQKIQSTYTPDVLSKTGSFGGLFNAPGRNNILVSSTDGVGTKIKIANWANKHDTIGQDLVNHCVNDILVHGAKPLFFLDYFGTSKIKPEIFNAVISGVCKACKQNNCALIGGETAEMPGIYDKDYDLVGTIVGVVHKNKVITGENIKSGDIVIGLKSSGLHTNGYSLVRSILKDEQLHIQLQDIPKGLPHTVEKYLLAVHRSYLTPIQSLMKAVDIKGLAHITGGGLYDNIPRILPQNVTVGIDTGLWDVPPFMKWLQSHGRITTQEMYRVFNMGIGMVVIVRSVDFYTTMRVLEKNMGVGDVIEIGSVCAGNGTVELY